MPNQTSTFGFLQPLVNDPVDQDLWGSYLNQDFDLIEAQFLVRTANYNFADYVLSRPIVQDYCEKLNALGNVSGAVNIDISLGNHVSMVLTGNVTSITITNAAPTGNAAGLLLYIKQGGSGSYTVSFPSSFKWAGNTTPTVTATLGSSDIYSAITRDAGTTWAAQTYGQGFLSL